MLAELTAIDRLEMDICEACKSECPYEYKCSLCICTIHASECYAFQKRLCAHLENDSVTLTFALLEQAWALANKENEEFIKRLVVKFTEGSKAKC